METTTTTKLIAIGYTGIGIAVGALLSQNGIPNWILCSIGLVTGFSAFILMLE